MRIVMAGASGFLGVAPAAAAGRRTGTTSSSWSAGRRRDDRTSAQWGPTRDELDPAALAGADAVINLAGAGVEDKRWNADVQAGAASTSRVDPTATLATAHRRAARRGAAPACCSTPRRSATTATPATRRSTSPRRPAPASSPTCARRWEAATDPASEAGVRVVLLRTGLVLDARRWAAPPAAARLPALRRRTAGRRAAVDAVDLHAGLGRRGRVPAGATRSPDRSTWSARIRCATADFTRALGARGAPTGAAARCRGSRCGSCSASSPTRRWRASASCRPC